VLFLSTQPVLAGFAQVLFGAAFFCPLSGLVKVNLATPIQKVLKNTLTHKDYMFTLNLSLPHGVIRFEPRNNQGVGDYTTCRSLFLCPKSLLSRLKNLPLWWGGLSEQLLDAAVQADFLPCRPKIEPLRGGLHLNQGVAIMRNNTQNLANSSQTNPQKTYLPKKAVFNLVTTKEILFKNLALPEALALFLSHPQARVKFSRMERFQ